MDEPEDTRQRILDVALELIGRQGFAATTTRELAERLGFSKAALYYHFKTKDELLTALIAPMLDTLRALVQADPSAVDRRAVLAGYVELVATFENPIRVLSSDPSVRARPPAAAAQPLYDRLMRMLAHDRHPTLEARAQARAALGGIHSVFDYARPDEDRAVLRAVALESAARALGLGPGPGRNG